VDAVLDELGHHVLEGLVDRARHRLAARILIVTMTTMITSVAIEQDTERECERSAPA
jgi:hypothetical protein